MISAKTELDSVRPELMQIGTPFRIKTVIEAGCGVTCLNPSTWVEDAFIEISRSAKVT